MPPTMQARPTVVAGIAIASPLDFKPWPDGYWKGR